jgi:hypothetical protein
MEVTMLKTMLAIAALTLAELSAAHAGYVNQGSSHSYLGTAHKGGNVPLMGTADPPDHSNPAGAHKGGNGNVLTPGPAGSGLPAHNADNVKPPPTPQFMSGNPEIPVGGNRIPPKIHGPNPGPLPLRDPRTE